MNEKELQQAFIQFLAQKTGAKSQQELEAVIQQLGEEGLKQAYAEFMQAMQQQQVQSAKFGAKLNYIKQLRGQCPDGYEVAYFKDGGMVKKGCKACNQKAQEIKEPSNAIEAFRCGRKTQEKSKKVTKAETGAISDDFVQNERNNRSEAAKSANTSHRNQASFYWNAFTGGEPSLTNLGKAAYHMYRSIPILGGEDESGSLATPLGVENSAAGLISTGGLAALPGIAKIAKTGQAAAQTDRTAKATKLYNSLSPAEQQNFNTFLKNGKSSLETITDGELWELRRLLKGNYVSTSRVEPMYVDRKASKGFWDMSENI